ncbi:CocE/NonD family hydrolase [bacterium]|nr:CocE/NonD family hydrolase [bacterium]
MKISLKRPAAILWALFTLFVLRVVGQITVLIAAPPFLPAWEEWFSGLLAYPYLLASQIALLILMTKMCRDVQHKRNYWGTAKRGLGEFLVTFGVVYLAVMVLRYGIRMSLYPAERWAGGSIPIFFHWVLSSFVLVLGSFHLKNSPQRTYSKIQIASRGLLWGVLLIGVGIWASFQLAPFILSKFLDARPAEYAVRVERSVGFTTSDGTRLVADVFHPQRVTQAPLILVRIPYTKTFVNSLFGNVIGRFWAERGYTVVLQGTRGRYESGGNYEPLIHEEADGKETLAWLKKQSWFNEKIGMWGGSYFGYTQLVLGDSTDPKIAAFLIQIASSDFSKMFFTDGAFALESAIQWALGSYGKTDSYPTPEKVMVAASAIPLVSADEKAEGTRIEFLRHWMVEPSGAAYWNKLDASAKLSQIQGPVLSMAGWFDPFLRAQLENYQRLLHSKNAAVARGSRLVIGPWAHARSVQLPDGFKPRHYRLESIGPALGWFDQHLKGWPAQSKDAKVRIFIMGKNEWREEAEWPLKRAQPTSYFLGGRKTGLIGSLSLGKAVSNGSEGYVYDPLRPFHGLGGAMIGPRAGSFRQAENASRPDVLTYDTEALRGPMEVTGYAKLYLTVQTSASSTDFTARILDVFPDGSSFNISDGIVRQKYVANQPTGIEIGFWPTSYLFKQGHKVRLEVSSSNFPRFDRNFNSTQPNALAETSQKAEQTVFYGQSRLLLPLIPEPPGPGGLND